MPNAIVQLAIFIASTVIGYFAVGTYLRSRPHRGPTVLDITAADVHDQLTRFSERANELLACKDEHTRHALVAIHEAEDAIRNARRSLGV